MSILSAAGHQKTGLLLFHIAMPLFLLSIVGFFFVTGAIMSVWHFLVFNLCASLLSAALGLYVIFTLFFRNLGTSNMLGPLPSYWGLFPFVINDIAIDGRANLPSLLLGALLSSEAVGYFRIAQSINGLIALLQVGIHQIIRTEAARLWYRVEKDALSHLMTYAARVYFLSGAAILVIFVATGKYFMLIVFGSYFEKAHLFTLILLTGTVLVSSAGFPGILLSMTGFASRSATIAIFTAILQLLLMPTLIGALGLNGAAWSMVLVNVVGAVSLAIVARQSNGIDSTILGSTRREVT
jgi:O-antigen/teichoic acid export membrane protein